MKYSDQVEARTYFTSVEYVMFFFFKPRLLKLYIHFSHSQFQKLFNLVKLVHLTKDIKEIKTLKKKYPATEMNSESTEQSRTNYESWLVQKRKCFDYEIEMVNFGFTVVQYCTKHAPTHILAMLHLITLNLHYIYELRSWNTGPPSIQEIIIS